MIRPLLPLLMMGTIASATDALTWSALPPLPEPRGVAAPFAGVSGGALLVAGGANFPGQMPWQGGTKVWSDRIWVLEKADGSWREAGQLPRPLAYGVSVTHGDRVICVGGSDAERHHAEVFALDFKNGAASAQPLPALPIALSGASGALLGDTLLVVGGAEQPGEQSASNRAWALDLASPTAAWRELPPLPGPPRILATAASHDDVFYLFGGASLSANAEGKIVRTYLRDAWSYRAKDGWRRLADLPKPSAGAPSPAPFAGGKLLLLAGDDGSRAGFQPVEKHPGFPAAILAFDPVRERWSEAGDVPAPRATVPCVTWRGAFVVPSGEVRPGVRSPQVWSFVAP